MNRTAVAVLAVAALVGGTGGAVAARARDHTGAHVGARTGPAAGTSPSRHPVASPSSASSTTSPSPSPSSRAIPTQAVASETNEPLLYADGRVIHDGERSVAFAPKDPIVRLVRVRGGWLAATQTSPRSAELQLWHVRPGARPVRLAGVSNWDVNPAGTQVVAFDFEAIELQVWDLADDQVLGRYAPRDGQEMTGVFVGGDVYVSEGRGASAVLDDWNVQTGETAKVSAGYPILGISPGGSYIVGAIGADGRQTGTDECLQLHSTPLKKYAVDWQSCTWRPADSFPIPFSPDGTRLLVQPSDANGARPAVFVVLDASDGPRTPVATVTAPKGARGAEWADSSHLYVYGADSETSAGSTWVKRCDLNGGCTSAVTGTRSLVVGSGL